MRRLPRAIYLIVLIIMAMVILVFQPYVRFPVDRDPWALNDSLLDKKSLEQRLGSTEKTTVRTLKIDPSGRPIGYNY